MPAAPYRFMSIAILLGLAAGAVRAADDQAPAVEEALDLLEIRVLGNTVLARTEIERAVYPSLGPGRTIAAVEQARVALETAYRDKGFGTVFVDIPEQRVEGGVVRLRVTEGRLDRVRVRGARYFSAGEIRAALPSAQRGEVLNLPAFQRELDAANRFSPDRAITPVLKAGSTPGTVDLDLRVEDRLPLRGALQLNDHFTANTSRLRAAAELAYDNLFQAGHSLSLQYQTAPREPRENRVIAATYVARLSDGGPLLAVYGVDTNSDVAAVGTLSVLGEGRIFGTRLIFPLIADARSTRSVTLGADYKDFAENVRLAPGAEFLTPIRYLSWSAAFSSSTRSESYTGSWDATANFGLRRALNDAQQFDDKRVGARPNFFYVRVSGQVERRIWNGFRLYGRLAGQASVDPLINNEQFFVGGATSVRGYPEALQLGDRGISGSLELRTPRLAVGLEPRLRDLYALLFVDAGLAELIDPLPGQADRFDLSSWGLGLRFRGLEGLEGSVDWARVLVPSGSLVAGDSRFQFNLRYGF